MQKAVGEKCTRRKRKAEKKDVVWAEGVKSELGTSDIVTL